MSILKKRQLKIDSKLNKIEPKEEKEKNLETKIQNFEIELFAKNSKKEKKIEKPKFLSVSILGIPNSGKSTLMNYLVNSKISAVSTKQQTTRENTVGILTTENIQIEFIDTPGIFNPNDKQL
jgi:tRNA U34 5-carboxymethylaminomethyl modifying GTPase MnmE/TrmE